MAHAGGGPRWAPSPAAARRGHALARNLAQVERDGGMNNFRRYCMSFEAPARRRRAAGGARRRRDVRAAALAETRAPAAHEGHNYQTKDMVHMTECFACATATRAARARARCRSACAPDARRPPRGGGGGDDIRIGILNILRDNGIKEGHRPGIECRFLQQWHQKLHSSTTKDDIAICEAYLNFLRGGNWDDDFFGHIYYHAGLTREDLQSMKVGWKNDDGISGPAEHLPYLIPAMEWFLGVLKTTHSGASLDAAADNAGWTMDEDAGLAWDVQDLRNNRNEWWVPSKILEIRQRLQHCWRGTEDGDRARDALQLDIALEQHVRGHVEAMHIGAMDANEVSTTLYLALENGAIASSGPACASRGAVVARERRGRRGALGRREPAARGVGRAAVRGAGARERDG